MQVNINNHTGEPRWRDVKTKDGYISCRDVNCFTDDPCEECILKLYREGKVHAELPLKTLKLLKRVRGND